MGAIILGAVVVVDAFVGVATSQEFARVLFGVAVILGLLLVGVALIVGVLAAVRISLAAVVWLATGRARP